MLGTGETMDVVQDFPPQEGQRNWKLALLSHDMNGASYGNMNGVGKGKFFYLYSRKRSLEYVILN